MALIWHGDKVNKRLRVWTREKLLKVLLWAEAEIKKSMVKGGRVEKAPTASGQRRLSKIGARRSSSSPPEPPYVQTGTLRRNITHEMHPTRTIGRVGTNVMYGKWLEFGTPRMAPRPFVRPVAHRAEKVAANIFNEGDFDRVV